MERLSLQDEYDYLMSAFGKNLFIHNGSSRAVFQFGEDRVIKIALDREGRLQNQNEVDLFKAAGNEYLAEIFAYGRFIIIMEEVREEYMEDMLDLASGDLGTSYDTATYDRLQDIMSFLEDHLGDTNDNYQLGFSTTRNKLVSYDYGYTTDINNEDMISNKLAHTIDMRGPEEVLIKTCRMLKILLDKSAKNCYNKV